MKHTASDYSKQKEKDNVFLAVRSPLEPKCYVKLELPQNMSAKDMASAFDMADFALSVADGRRSFGEYPTNDLGLLGIRVLSTSASKTELDKLIKSKIAGMHGAVTFIAFFEKYLECARPIKTSFLSAELTHLYAQCGWWALAFCADKFLHPNYNVAKERAIKLGEFIQLHLQSLQQNTNTPKTLGMSPMLNCGLKPENIVTPESTPTGSSLLHSTVLTTEGVLVSPTVESTPPSEPIVQLESKETTSIVEEQSKPETTFNTKEESESKNEEIKVETIEEPKEEKILTKIEVTPDVESKKEEEPILYNINLVTTPQTQ